MSVLLFGLNRYTYLITLFLGAFGWLFFDPGVYSYLWSHTRDEDTGKVLSIKDTFGAVGEFLSGLVLLVTLLLPVQMVGIGAGILFLFAIFFIVKSPKDAFDFADNREDDKNFWNFHRTSVRLGKIVKAVFRLRPVSMVLMITNFCSGIFYGVVWFTVPLMIVANKNDMIMGMSLASFNIAILLVGFWIGKIVDKFNKKMLVFWGLLIFSLSGIFLGFSNGLWFILIGFLGTVGDELSTLSLWAWLNYLDKENKDDGTIAGIFSLFNDLGWTIGPIGAGILYAKFGPEWAIAFGGGIIMIGWILYSVKFKGFQSFADINLSLVPRKPHKARMKR